MEKISVLMDGELEGAEAREQIRRLKQDETLLESWHLFHLIGDVMRDERPLSAGFASRIASRIAREPTVIAPHRIAPVSRRLTVVLSAAASLAAVAAVGWMAFSTGPSAPPAQLAGAPAVSVPAVTVPVTTLANVPSDGTMNEYLMAHQAFSPSTAIQGLAPYIRSVSTSRQAQGR